MRTIRQRLRKYLAYVTTCLINLTAASTIHALQSVLDGGIQMYDKYTFAKQDCPRPHHLCNGQHIPDIVNGQDVSGEQDIGICQYWDVEYRCIHEKYPRGQKMKARGKYARRG